MAISFIGGGNQSSQKVEEKKKDCWNSEITVSLKFSGSQGLTDYI